MRKNDVTIPAQPEILEMAKKILMFAGSPYTPEQQAEIPAILAVKAKYFFGTDHQDTEVLMDVFTKEGFSTWWNGHPGAASAEGQCQAALISCPKEGEDAMVPLHFGHNQIEMFTGEKSAQVLTRMRDFHTYIDNGEAYEGYGFYVDDFVKCEDGKWRIQTLRLQYRVMNGQLRCQRKK